MTKSILILGTDPCRSFELQDAILRARMNVQTHIRHRSDDQDWNGADIIVCSGDSPELAMLLDFVERRKPAARVVILRDPGQDLEFSPAYVRSIIDGQTPGKLFAAA